MSKFSRETEVLVGNQTLKIEEILKTIIYLPAEQVLEFFKDIGLNIPRELRIYVLRENLREKVAETRKTRLTLADELNYRLSWFTEFTETQLENLLVFFNDQKIVKQYLEDFWTDLFGYMVDKKVPEFELEKLYKASLDYVKENDLVLPDIAKYNRTLEDLFFDSFGRIDGVSPNKIRNVLYKSSTITEIRDLGKKYEVNIPRRLKKNQLADIIVEELKDKGLYTEDLEKQVRSMSVIIMQRFAIDHDIKASTELKKEEVIEYILKNSKETKETYFVPKSRDVYEQELSSPDVDDSKPSEETTVEEVKPQEEEKEVEPEVVEEIVEEPVIEEEVQEVETVVEEVKPQEEEKVVERVVEYVQPSINLDALVDEVRKLRETVENFELKANESNVEDEHPIPLYEVEPEPIRGPKVEEINTVEYHGTKKSYKKVIKNDEAEERQAYVEEKKAEIAQEKAETEEKDVPVELRAIGRFFKFIGNVLLKIVLFAVKWVAILAVIGLVLLVIYALLDYFLEFSFLDSFTSTLNGVKINGIGIIDHLFNFFNTLGLEQATS